MSERFQSTSFQLPGSFVTNLQGFRDATQEIGGFFNKKRAEKAAAEGAAAVDPSDPQLPEQRGTFRASNRAFNQSSLQAYTAAINNDALENTARIQDENIDNPESFQKSFDGYKLGLLSEIPDEVKPGIIQMLDGLETKARINVGKNFRNKAEAENAILINAEQDALKKEIGLSTDEMKKLIREGDEEGTVALLRVIGGLTGQLTNLPEAEEILQNVNKAAFMENETADFINFIQSPDPQAKFQAAKELERLRLLTPPKGISLEEWDKQVDGVVQEASDLTEARKKARAVEQESFEAENTFKLSDLTTLNNDGLVSRDQLGQAFENGIIPTKEKLFQMDQARQKAFQDGQEERKVIRRLNGDTSVVLDAGAVNEFYIKNVAELSVAEKALYTDKVKMVPAELRAQVDTQLLSGEVDQVTEAASLIDAIDQVPGLESPFSNNVRANADLVVKLSKNLAPAEAVKIAATLTNPVDQNRIEAKDKEFQELTTASFGGVDLSVDDIIERGLFNINIPPSPLNKANMQVEYTDQVKALFLSGMSIDDAQSRAASIVRRNWKDQEFMGKSEAFKYPLADYYAVEGSIKYAENQLLTDVQDNMVFANPVQKEDIFLLSDKRTADEASTGKPSYLIYVVQDGQFLQTGQRFRPDAEEAVKARDVRLKKLRERPTKGSEILRSDFEGFKAL